MRTTTYCLIAAIAVTTSGCEFLQNTVFDRGQKFEAPVPQPARAVRPISVGFEADTVFVGMDDMQQCRGNAGAASGSGNGWTGTLKECDYPYTYEVVLAAGTPPGFLVLAEVPGPISPPAEGEVPFRPLAVVTVTDMIGQRYRFESSAGF